jgi:hypothetical protein
MSRVIQIATIDFVCNLLNDPSLAFSVLYMHKRMQEKIKLNMKDAAIEA